jgi:hypothetical protein
MCVVLITIIAIYLVYLIYLVTIIIAIIMTTNMALDYEKIANSKQSVTSVINTFKIFLVTTLLVIVINAAIIYLITVVNIDRQQCYIKNYDDLCDTTNSDYSEKECKSVMKFDGCMIVYNNTRIKKKVESHVYGTTCVNNNNITCYLDYLMSQSNDKRWYVTLSKYRILVNAGVWSFINICVVAPITLVILFFVLMNNNDNCYEHFKTVIKSMYKDESVITEKIKKIYKFIIKVNNYIFCMYGSIIWLVISLIGLFEPITCFNDILINTCYIMLCFGPLCTSVYMMNKYCNIMRVIMFSFINDKNISL